MTDDNMIQVEGMQRVDCDLCGVNLGFQSADTPILREEWRHNRCPARLAELWGMTREQVEQMTVFVQAGIQASYPDFPFDEEMRARRSRIAAEQALEMLAGLDIEVRFR